MLTKDEAEALQNFMDAIRNHDPQCILVGAGARQVMLDWKHGITDGRATTDWDFAVRVPTWQRFHDLLNRLTQPPAGRFERTSSEHRVRHRATRTCVDLIPFGKIANPDGEIVWPSSRHRMSVLGLEDALRAATPCKLGETTVRVVPIACLIVLKLFALDDRAASKDLDDIDLVLANAEHTEFDRILDELGPKLASGELDFEDAGPYLLGRDAATLVSAPTLRRANEILTSLVDEPERRRLARLITDMGRVGRRGVEAVARRLRALRTGITAPGTQ